MQGLHATKKFAALAALTAGSLPALAALTAGSLPAQAAPAAPVVPKADAVLARALAAPAARGWTSAIVKTGRPLTAGQQAQIAALGADVTRHLSLIGSLELRVPARNLASLAALPFVTHLSADGAVQKCDEFTVGASGAGAAFQQYGLTGSGVTVAVVDSGINAHADLTGSSGTRVVAGVSFVPGTADPNDYCGHGTHVAGILAGNGRMSTGENFRRTFYGVARQASLVNVRVLDSNGAGTVGQVIAGVQWVVANAAKYRIKVMNLSLGHPVGESYTTDPLCQAVEQAYRAGIVVVCAAGNNGRLNATNTAGLDNEGWGTAYGSINSPGNDPYVLTVGAMKQMDTVRNDDRVATYSSRGPSRLDLIMKPDIVAPGNLVISLARPSSTLFISHGGTNIIPWTAYQYSEDSTYVSCDYFRLSGTSMAAPVVAGAAALMLQKYPTLTPDTVKARLMLSADKWADPAGSMDPCTYGAGYLDIPAALACTVVAAQPAMSPDMSVDSAGNVYVNMDRAIWGHSSLWSTGSLTDLRAIWGKFAIAGTSANVLSGSRAIWGRSVWGDRAVWGSTSGTASSVDLSAIAISGEGGAPVNTYHPSDQ